MFDGKEGFGCFGVGERGVYRYVFKVFLFKNRFSRVIVS